MGNYPLVGERRRLLSTLFYFMSPSLLADRTNPFSSAGGYSAVALYMAGSGGSAPRKAHLGGKPHAIASGRGGRIS